MVLLDFSMTPLGKGESVSPYVARCLEVVAPSGLDYHLHAMGTTLEGELDQVLDVVRRCFGALQSAGEFCAPSCMGRLTRPPTRLIRMRTLSTPELAHLKPLRTLRGKHFDWSPCRISWLLTTAS